MSELSHKDVPFFRYPHVYTEMQDDFRDAFEAVCGRGAFIDQQECADFEKSLAEYVGTRHAVGVGNATDGLMLAVGAAGIGNGDEVIFSSHTFVATGASIHYSGAQPVPVECREDLMIDPAAVEAAITPRTKAVMVTQLNGRCCEMDTIEAICQAKGLILLEDAAQGLGSKHKARSAGTFGVANAISFYPAKNLGALGDAGAVVTDDADLLARIRCLRDHGRNDEGEVVMWGVNTRMDNLQAAFLNVRLAKYDVLVAKRRAIAAQYHEALKDVGELILPPPPVEDGDYFDVYQNYEIQAERRDELKRYLKSRGVGTILQWGGKAVHQFKDLGLGEYSLPYTDSIFQKLMLLPMNTSLSEDDVAHVSQCVREFYQG